MTPTNVRRPAKVGRFKKLSHQKVARMLLDYDCGESMASVARRYDISAGAFTHWKPYVGLTAKWLAHVRGLEQENDYLNRRILQLEHKLRATTKLIRSLETRRKRRSLYSASLQAVFNLSRTDANAACGLAHSVGHQGVAQEGDKRLVAVMRKYLAENPGDGFRGMFHVLLRDENCTRGHARMLYYQAMLQRRWRKKPAPLPERVVRKIKPAGHRDQIWSMDFLMDVLPSGRRFFVFSALDDYCREGVICRVLPKATATATVEALELARLQGRVPGTIRSDNGGQFKSATYLHWTDRYQVRRRYSRPGHCEDNPIAESFNATLRREVLDCYKFRSLAEVQRMLDDWRVRYNFGRPHTSLQGLSPLQFAELHSIK
ncbi:IS3 family transposase [Luteimonas viscosa]|nr:IS3 family transposase [Luteimonas viscosa]